MRLSFAIRLVCNISQVPWKKVAIKYFNICSPPYKMTCHFTIFFILSTDHTRMHIIGCGTLQRVFYCNTCRTLVLQQPSYGIKTLNFTLMHSRVGISNALYPNSIAAVGCSTLSPFDTYAICPRSLEIIPGFEAKTIVHLHTKYGHFNWKSVANVTQCWHSCRGDEIFSKCIYYGDILMSKDGETDQEATV